MTYSRRKKVLPVEDDTVLAQQCCGVLRMSGFDAAYVIDGISALRKVEDEPPDLIVLDMNLPVLGGRELLKEIAARPDLRQIPAIVVTGTGTPLDLAVEQAKQILRKPCAPERPVSVVERYVRAA
jgi:CheY-like chemotaxis protein